MSDIQINIGVTHTKKPKVGWQPLDAIAFDQSGVGRFAYTQTIGTTAEDVAFGDISPGLVILVNLDDTNFVSFGMSDGGTIKKLGRLYPTTRVPAVFMLEPGQTLRMQADTGPCQVDIVAYAL